MSVEFVIWYLGVAKWSVGRYVRDELVAVVTKLIIFFEGEIVVVFFYFAFLCGDDEGVEIIFFLTDWLFKWGKYNFNFKVNIWNYDYSLLGF